MVSQINVNKSFLPGILCWITSKRRRHLAKENTIGIVAIAVLVQVTEIAGTVRARTVEMLPTTRILKLLAGRVSI